MGGMGADSPKFLKLRSAFPAAALILLPALIFVPVQSTTLEVDVDLINVFLTVHDANGRYVTGLDRESFEVYEDDERRPIEIFETGDGVLSSLGLLIDNSGSSADILGSVRSGVRDFSRGLGPDDQMFVISFGTEVSLIHDFGESPASLATSLETLRPWGTSLFFDALELGIGKVAGGRHARKALIVLTDGEDNGSVRTYLEVVRAAESRMVLLYFIGMGPSILVDTHTLNGLASMTGGSVVLMAGDDSPRDALEAIREDLAHQYYIGYYSAAGAGYHSIRVEVPGAGVTVRAREGYLVEAE